MRIVVTSLYYPIHGPKGLAERAARMLVKTLRHTRLGNFGVVVWGEHENSLDERDLEILNADEKISARVATSNEIRGIPEQRRASLS